MANTLAEVAALSRRASVGGGHFSVLNTVHKSPSVGYGMLGQGFGSFDFVVRFPSGQLMRISADCERRLGSVKQEVATGSGIPGDRQVWVLDGLLREGDHLTLKDLDFHKSSGYAFLFDSTALPLPRNPRKRGREGGGPAHAEQAAVVARAAADRAQAARRVARRTSAILLHNHAVDNFTTLSLTEIQGVLHQVLDLAAAGMTPAPVGSWTGWRPRAVPGEGRGRIGSTPKDSNAGGS